MDMTGAGGEAALIIMSSDPESQYPDIAPTVPDCADCAMLNNLALHLELRTRSFKMTVNYYCERSYE